jgi:hypothetical protein
VTDLTVSLTGLAAGRWRVTWVDDDTGRDLASAEAVVQDGRARVTLAAPPFARHVALLLDRLAR